MFWLDIAIAARRDAERAFFDDGSDTDGDDGIARVRLEGLSDFELAHLGMLLAGGYTPRLVLDGDSADEIVTEMDPKLVAALGGLGEDALGDAASRWQAAAGTERGLAEALATLREFARQARAAGLPVLYAQGSDLPDEEEDEDGDETGD